MFRCLESFFQLVCVSCVKIVNCHHFCVCGFFQSWFCFEGTASLHICVSLFFPACLTELVMNARSRTMDGWMDGWVNGWMDDGWMDGQTDGQVDG